MVTFPDENKGGIVIDFRIEDDNDIIRFSDKGVGLPEAVTFDHPATPGMQLPKGLTHQLNGTISVDRTGGNKYTIIFPADSEEDGLNMSPLWKERMTLAIQQSAGSTEACEASDRNRDHQPDR